MKRMISLVLALMAAALLTPCLAAEPAAAQSKPAGARIEMGVGHFNRDGKAFHYWDQAAEIPAGCARCHAAQGVPEYLANGKNAPAKQVKNAYACTNCHADMLSYERHKVSKVTFASGLEVDAGLNDANLCMTCHQGRESTASVNKAIAGKVLDTPDPALAFIHVHYFPAGATLFGTQAKVAYEFAGKTYDGRYKHPKQLDNCLACHDPHSGHAKVEKCDSCHTDKGDRIADYRSELKQSMDALYAGIQQYAIKVGGVPLAYSSKASPYWYTDSNGNGVVDDDELKPTNSYKAYTPRLLQAVFNYTFLLRDPGAAFHNRSYAGQIVHDSLESLAVSGQAGVNMKGRTRP
ncbi:hypothetical protein [Uliginosibacterium sp. 31-12]|uniref:hypothetical protein n=1 Tax=Uliginosibacterium sp. 31-12 TaxID=3062781 RepID=UPI0026E2E30B|nr:hypothetical protein [Uliginosibacterium sp. 31-12]MDO6388154.1 hypothetical protein [Uliginosibacterium sp. 31-12]